jgi:SEC-C motif-containing protein
MRSRYSAYVVRDIAYLLRSWHPSTRPDKIDPVAIPAWYELIIIHTEKGQETDNEGVVEFQAAAFSQKSILSLHEVSRFVKENNQWFYVDGEIKDDSHPVEGHEPKVGRNSPCPCGSGRKFKKCCGR